MKKIHNKAEILDRISKKLHPNHNHTNARVLVTHPNNFHWLQDSIRKISDLDYVNMIYGYKIFVDTEVPEEIESRELEWKQDYLVTYGGGPANKDLSYHEYISMCLYFGWCKYKTKKCFYELNRDLKFKNSLEELIQMNLPRIRGQLIQQKRGNDEIKS